MKGVHLTNHKTPGVLKQIKKKKKRTLEEGGSEGLGFTFLAQPPPNLCKTSELKTDLDISGH